MWLLLWACSRPPPPPPLVALITIDTWRADHLSPTHSPRLWALAAQGRRYTNAWSPIGLTSAAHATMLTGVMPWEHGLRANNHHGYALREDLPTVAQTLGLPAAAFVSAWPAGPEGGLARGFLVFDGPESGEREGGVAVQRALHWMAGQQRGFLWVHLYEPHGPYVGAGRTEAERYAEEVRRADALLTPLIDELVRRKSRIVVAADHGEVLDEEPCSFQHDRSAHEAVLRVPLVVWGPGVAPEVSAERVGLADVPELLRGDRPRARSHWIGESGLCEPSCAPGCDPPGLSGRDAVAIDDGGRWVQRPGRGRWSEGRPAPSLEDALRGLPSVPLPEGAQPEEARLLGYLVPEDEQRR